MDELRGPLRQDQNVMESRPSVPESTNCGLGAVVAQRGSSGTSVPSKWCLEADTMFNVIARRNALLALWAGRKIGLGTDSLPRYAEADVRRKLTEFHKEALRQSNATD